jgi:membrane-bound acyltransferase YfiQ involved in biofilm formation
MDWRSMLALTERFFFIQKISLCFLLLPLFNKLENYNLPIISKIATYSFSIYFLHNIIVHHWWVNDVYAILPATNSLVGVGVSLAFAMVKFALVLGICMGLKTLLGKYSRMVIGS